MASSYSKSKGRKEAGNFFMFPKSIWACDNYKNLSLIARSLLLEIAMQYNGKNNGDLTACYSDLNKRGWASNTTIKKHLNELLHYGFIVCVQKGGINCGSKQRPNLYALTWLQIDKVGYSDGFSQKSQWKVGETPGIWKLKRNQYRQQTKKRKPPAKKNEGHLVYLTSTTSCSSGGRI